MPDHNPLKTMADATKAWADFVAYLGLSRAAADPEQRYRMIQRAAYYRAEKRGFDGGDPSLDWIEAEREIERMLQGPAGMHAYLEHLEARLKLWDKQFKDIEALSGVARTKYDKHLQALASRRAMINDELHKLRSNSGEAWHDLKQSIEKIWDEMQLAAEKMASHFKDKNNSSGDKGAR